MKLIEYGYDEDYGDKFCDVIKDVENLEEAKKAVKSYIEKNWDDVVIYNENSWIGNTYSVDEEDANDNWCGWLKFKVI